MDDRLFESLAKGHGRPYAVCPECGTVIVRLMRVGPITEGYEGPDARIGFVCGNGHAFEWLLKAHEDSVFLSPEE